jgi:hypothetical protein
LVDLADQGRMAEVLITWCRVRRVFSREVVISHGSHTVLEGGDRHLSVLAASRQHAQDSVRESRVAESGQSLSRYPQVGSDLEVGVIVAHSELLQLLPSEVCAPARETLERGVRLVDTPVECAIAT